jgi:hypothetical protein
MGPFESSPREAKTEEELRSLIIAQVRDFTPCKKFGAEFRLIRVGAQKERDPTWDLFGRVHLTGDSRQECQEQFAAAIAKAQRLYDLKQ